MSDTGTTEQNTPVVAIVPHDARRAIPVTAHGAWGGVSPGAVVVHLYVDYPQLPSKWGLLADGSQILEDDENIVVREIVTTITVSPSVAEEIGQVFLRAAAALRQALAPSEEDDAEE